MLEDRLDQVSRVMDVHETAILSSLTPESVHDAIQQLTELNTVLMNIADEQLVEMYRFFYLFTTLSYSLRGEQDDLSQIYSRLFNLLTIYQDYQSQQTLRFMIEPQKDIKGDTSLVYREEQKEDDLSKFAEQLLNHELNKLHQEFYEIK